MDWCRLHLHIYKISNTPEIEQVHTSSNLQADITAEPSISNHMFWTSPLINVFFDMGFANMDWVPKHFN